MFIAHQTVSNSSAVLKPPRWLNSQYGELLRAPFFAMQYPTNISDGDLLLVTWSGSSTNPIKLPDEEGWTNVKIGNLSANYSCGFSYRISNGVEQSTLKIVTGDIDADYTFALHRFADVDPGLPIEEEQHQFGYGKLATFHAVSPSSTSCLVLHFAATEMANGDNPFISFGPGLDMVYRSKTNQLSALAYVENLAQGERRGDTINLGGSAGPVKWTTATLVLSPRVE